MGISFQLRTGFDLPPRVVVEHQTGDGLSLALVAAGHRLDESEGEPSARPATPADKEAAHRRSHLQLRCSISASQPLGCLFCAWPWLLTFRLGTLVAGI